MTQTQVEHLTEISKTLAVPMEQLSKGAEELNNLIDHLQQNSKQVARDILTKYNFIIKEVSIYATSQLIALNHLLIDIQRGRLSSAALGKLDFAKALEIVQNIIELQTLINEKMHLLSVEKKKISKATLAASLVGGLSAVVLAIVLPFTAPVEIAIASAVVIGASGVTQAAAVVTAAVIKHKTVEDCITATNNTIDYITKVKTHLNKVSESLHETSGEITKVQADATLQTVSSAIKAVTKTQQIVQLQVQIK